MNSNISPGVENCIWISLPTIPPPNTLLSQTINENDLIKDNEQWLYSFSKKSIPISGIAAKLNPNKNSHSTLSKPKTLILSEIFFHLDSPIEKYFLLRLIIPHRARGQLVTKQQLIKLLLKYTRTENLKAGVLRSKIDSITLGKTTQTIPQELIQDVISVLESYWIECQTLKNSDFTRLSNVSQHYNNQITLDDINSVLDDLHRFRSESTNMDFLYPTVELIFDIFYTIANPFTNKIDKNTRYTLELIISCMMCRSTINERMVFNAVCLKPKGLASSIWYSRSNLWDVIYGIEYLKNKDVHLWKKMLDMTKNKNNRRLSASSLSKNIILVVKISVGIPFTVMRCIRKYGDYADIVDKVSIFEDNVRQETEGYCIEEKLDGERSVLHIFRDKHDSNKIYTQFYSRHHVVQSWYGSYVGDPDGIITKYMKVEWFDDIQDLILDGEMITFDEEKNRLLGFQDVKTCCEMSRRLLREGKDLQELKIYNKLLVYDILYLNGESLQLTKLKERKDKLYKIFEKIDDDFKFIQLHKWNIGYNANDLKMAMDNVIHKNSEGLVIKHWNSLYFVGKYSPQWIKLKPYYLMDFIDDLDVLIIAKEGSNYICALYGGDTNNGDDGDGDDGGDKFRGWFVSFCLVRFGFSNEISKYIDDKTNGHWIKYKRYESEIEMQDHHVRFGKLKPHYWIHPDNSVVIKIKAKSLITLSDQIENRFLLDTTLRFPYCIAVRHDKEYLECDTIAHYKEMVAKQGKKNPFDENEERYTKHKKRKKETKMDIVLKGVNKNFITTIVKKDELFKGISFCVKTDCLVDGEWLPLNEINGILESHGGKIISDPSHSTASSGRILIIADKHTLVVHELRKNYNIFKFKWCADCIRSDQLVKLDPSHCLLVDDDVYTMSQKSIDAFGFNDTIKYDEKELWDNSKNYEKSEVVYEQLDNEGCEKLGFLFFNKKFCLVGFDETNSFQREILELQIEIHGGELIIEVANADFVVVPDYNINKSILPKDVVIKTADEIFKQINY